MKQKFKISAKKIMLLSFASLMFFNMILVVSLVFMHEKSELNERINFIRNKMESEQKSYVKSVVDEQLREIRFLEMVHPDLSADSLKKIILKSAGNKMLRYGGYIFINDYSGKALLFDGKIMTSEKDVSNMTDIDGKPLFKLEQDAYNSPEGAFMEYKFKPLYGSKPEPKLSYIKGYHKWGWIIGAGIYLHKPQLIVDKMIKNYRRTTLHEVLIAFIISLGVLILAFFLVFYYNRALLDQIDYIKSFFKKPGALSEKIDTRPLIFQELYDISMSVNTYIDELHILFEQNEIKSKEIKSIINAAENISFSIVSVDKDPYEVMEFSPGSEKLFGISKDEISQRIRKGLLKVHDKISEFPKVIQKVKNGIVQGESEFYRMDGTKFYGWYSLYPMYFNNQFKGIICIIVDITKRKNVEDELNELKNRLEEKVMERTQELEQKNQKLEKFNRLFVDREFRIKELKEKLAKYQKEDNHG